MSEFSNAPGAGPDEVGRYVAAVLGLVGDAEPLAVLAELPAATRRVAAGLDDASLGRPEAPGKWSMVEVLGHLADSELVWAWRLRLVLAEDRPTLTGYDQERWARRFDYAAQDPGEVLERLALLRAENLRLLRAVTPADLERVGLHAERGEESVGHMIRLYAGHDLVHRRQLERIRAELG